MSFLGRATPALRASFQQVTRPSPRFFSVAAVYQKSVSETVADAAKKVDRAVSDAAVSGIDKGTELKDQAAAATGMGAKEAEGTASEISGQAKGKASELAGKAKGAVSEAEGKMKS